MVKDGMLREPESDKPCRVDKRLSDLFQLKSAQVKLAKVGTSDTKTKDAVEKK